MGWFGSGGQAHLENPRDGKSSVADRLIGTLEAYQFMAQVPFRACAPTHVLLQSYWRLSLSLLSTTNNDEPETELHTASGQLKPPRQPSQLHVWHQKRSHSTCYHDLMSTAQSAHILGTQLATRRAVANGLNRDRHSTLDIYVQYRARIADNAW